MCVNTYIHVTCIRLHTRKHTYTHTHIHTYTYTQEDNRPRKRRIQWLDESAGNLESYDCQRQKAVEAGERRGEKRGSARERACARETDW